MPKEKEKTYSDAEVAQKIKDAGLAEWSLEDGWLRRKYTTDGWPTTLMLSISPAALTASRSSLL